MAKKGERKSKLLEEAIDKSIEFEKLMDKTDFDSWLEDDNHDKLRELGQQIIPFKKFEENKEKIKSICCKMKKKGSNELHKSGDKSSLEKYIVYKLFESKIKRLKARICSNKEDEEKEYYKTLSNLLSALNVLQNMEVNNNDKWWLVLLYNDLSICYAGLENSSMSRGYAEEAKRIIDKEESCKDFIRKLRTDNATNGEDIENLEFVSSKLYDLYIVALFNQALAEKRSYLYSDAEKNFRKIIEYADRDTHLLNFNYYSALLNLSDLYMDQGRGKEAIEFLKKVKKLDEYDIRYWNAYLAEITALIDQSEYCKAEKLLSKFFKEEDGFTLCESHKVTSAGFKGLNYYVRCKIEKGMNTLEIDDKNNKGELEKAETITLDNIDIIKKRHQKGLETKAYKQLSDIYKIQKNDKKAREYLTKFISDTEIDNLDAFIDSLKWGNWIDKCDDLNALESFTDQIIKIMTDKSIDKYKDLLEKIKEKIIKECEDKDQLSRAERIARKINEAKKEEEYDKFKKFLSSEKTKFFKTKKDKNDIDLTKEDIRKRLDINEKEFDSVLFERSKLKKADHIIEVIVLRRWSSFSPGLFRESTGSLGGGYLLRIKKIFKKGDEEGNGEDIENIVIDPGYNFLQSFCGEGLYIKDIDTIIVTHSHLDHCAELLQVMDLIYQINKRHNKYCDKRSKSKKKVNLCLSQGAYKKFSSYIDDPEWKKQLKDVIILENLREGKWEYFEGLTISAIKTPHWDFGGVNAIGLKIEIDRIEKKKLCLGFTSDTPWYPKIREDFKGCGLLCVHLGSIKYQEIGYTDKRYDKDTERGIPETEKLKKLREIYSESNHLLFFGTEDVIKCCAKEKENKLIIVGEFGEELKYGLRNDLCKKLSKETKIDCLPGDIGLYIGIDKDGAKKVRCNFCEEFVGQKEIGTFSYGREDAIHYICETCHNTLSEVQKQAFVEHRLKRH